MRVRKPEQSPGPRSPHRAQGWVKPSAVEEDDVEQGYRGIDVSKAWLDVGTWPEAASQRVSNDAAGVAELVQRLSASKPRAVVLEASGGLNGAKKPTSYDRYLS